MTHILSATLFVSNMAYCIYLWRSIHAHAVKLINLITWFVIAPFAIIQLVTGFALLGLKQEEFTQVWVKSSVIFFIIAMSGWFIFAHLLRINKSSRSLELFSLIVSVTSVLCMIFFMASKI